jgi:hypothetical protein
MTVKERLHELIEELPESDLTVAERMLRGLKLPTEKESAAATGTREERRARIYALAGKYAGSLSPVDEFLARKHREKAREGVRC